MFENIFLNLIDLACAMLYGNCMLIIAHLLIHLNKSYEETCEEGYDEEEYEEA